jgi:endonuclease-8
VLLLGKNIPNESRPENNIKPDQTMPEGPSIVILKELLQPFAGKIIRNAAGNTKALHPSDLRGEKLLAVKSWGKHLLICFPQFTIRIHLMLYGSYRINARKEIPARLSLQFDQEEINFYNCSVARLDIPLDEVYDWSADVMSDAWDNRKAIQKLLALPEKMACDALLDQQIFSGSGNIIKNEVLFRVRVHPESELGKLPLKKMKELVDETIGYSHQFYVWRKSFALRKHWLVYNKRICPRDEVPLEKKILGKTRRRSFYCAICQTLYK